MNDDLDDPFINVSVQLQNAFICKNSQRAALWLIKTYLYYNSYVDYFTLILHLNFHSNTKKIICLNFRAFYTKTEYKICLILLKQIDLG